VVNRISRAFQIFFSLYFCPVKLFLSFGLILCLCFPSLRAQSDSPAPADVRVSVVLNPDHSRTTYETDAANHKTTATTAGPDGKLREKILYDLDENGRFVRGEVYGPKQQFRFAALYKYDANNHLVEETHFTKDKSVIGKIVFQYDAAGHQIGYATYDGAGRLLGQTTAGKTSPSPVHGKRP